MPDIRKITLSSQMAETLRREIKAGLWSGKLPGYRVLGPRYGVSRPVCEAALRELAAAGWIASGGVRGRWTIIHAGSSQAETAKSPDMGLLLWITSERPQSLDQSAQVLLEHSRSEWEKLGGRMTVAVVDFARVRNPETQLNTLIKRHGASRILLQNGPRKLVQAAATLRIPVFTLGGEVGLDLSRDGVGIPLAKTLEQTISQFRQLGRNRIMVPVLAGMEAWRQGAVKALEVGGEAISSDLEPWVPEIHDNFPEAIHARWEVLLRELKPNAVLLMDPLWAISLYCAAWGMGMKPGKDLLVVTSNSLTPLEWLQPRPVTLQIPYQKIRDRIVRWMQNSGEPEGFLQIPAEWPEPLPLAPPHQSIS